MILLVSLVLAQQPLSALLVTHKRLWPLLPVAATLITHGMDLRVGTLALVRALAGRVRDLLLINA